MKVTQIKPQVKRSDRFSIFIDNKYSFSLSDIELTNLKLRVGQDLTEKELTELNEESIFSNAKNACFRLLSYRARSTGEIIDYLKRKKYNDDLSNRLVEYLTKNEFLNDEKFCNQWVDNRLQLRHASLTQIKHELRQKKISSSIIDKVLAEKSVNEVETIRDLIVKKRTLSKYQDDTKLMQYLSRKGFGYNEIMVALGKRAE